ncbi:heme lyase CcmF/NrfE family subunit [Acuticoccus sp. I52.16.1]|uniref:heme lyase CcmF/NrfE family subunit n=1 Tax=Acuticoccus sp. I52.16.1 TaxID=2928472 RepID=UPI001FD62DC9|nr:heme lyase CcmF/NrfE family subunit [Acuticoccus sp. I52.16.1]UOM34249.1 heme lyase CcmF/NrfE family subunit [Acuticoccus sp. I52.16.1]
MLNEVGHFALVLALTIALVQSILPIVGARTGDARLMATAAPCAGAVFALIGFAFVALAAAYIRSDFSLANVFENSHSAKPLIYKISGVWGNHEGSMLLWVLVLALFGLLAATLGRNMPLSLRATVVAVQGWVSTAFLAFILATSNPFERLFPAPLEGQDLNPLLQDIGLAIHPPLLYVGYVGFSIVFAFAVAALIEGRIDAAWARWVRPWVLISWIFLTLGIAMGSYWAYYELGWGGWWFWDPVENASFMPWLAGTALLHSAAVMEKRDALKVWTVLLAIITFSLSLLGTFLVRSGVLTSVHAFASDPTRGLFILMILAAFIGGAFLLFALRAGALKAGGAFAPMSREGALVFNNVFLTTACATVLVGTLYPLVLETLTGGKISVGPPYFNLTFIPLMVPLFAVLPFGPLLAWKRGDAAAAAQRLIPAAAVAVVGAAVSAWLAGEETALTAAFGVALGLYLVVGSVAELWLRTGRQSIAARLGRLTRLPRSTWGTALGHLGVGVTVLGIAALSAFETEVIRDMAPGDSATIAGTEVYFVRPERVEGPNYTDTVAVFEVRRGGRAVAELRPAKRHYPARNMPTTEAAIRTVGASQLYVTLGEVADGKVVVRLFHKPLVLLIWIGAVVAAAGGVLSLADRKLRIGLPAPARRRRDAGGAAEAGA